MAAGEELQLVVNELATAHVVWGSAKLVSSDFE